ncbi:rubrerythrin-like domain-containing protein [Halorubrum sp. Atlit-28R]|nr:rubrerythrin-like domain-containing protein [Halorubrum sp. Atlit-28R]RLM49880.1 rubrerythrin-like domain-containing protein [Halorubrum sp. Atlit-28R]
MTRNASQSPSSSGDQYECRDCLSRLWTDGGLSSCPQCGGDVENLSKPRE